MADILFLIAIIAIAASLPALIAWASYLLTQRESMHASASSNISARLFIVKVLSFVILSGIAWNWLNMPQEPGVHLVGEVVAVGKMHKDGSVSAHIVFSAAEAIDISLPKAAKPSERVSCIKRQRRLTGGDDYQCQLLPYQSDQAPRKLN